MSDRTYAQLVVHTITPEELHALRNALADSDWSDMNEEPGPGDELLRWGWDEAPLDAFEQLAEIVTKAAPGAAFSAWVDPKHEYSGAIARRRPGETVWYGPCDADGNVYVLEFQVREAARIADLNPAEAVRNILDLVGGAESFPS